MKSRIASLPTPPPPLSLNDHLKLSVIAEFRRCEWRTVLCNCYHFCRGCDYQVFLFILVSPVTVIAAFIVVNLMIVPLGLPGSVPASPAIVHLTE